ncbi:sigma-54-dependent Fis family transcriptional regulator [Verticiella sediminum]|uniref:Sigma-54-dependent Fis family transcriptional regulator n=1 Tax=Verticiella sediminum TaxID=1247510 RepID=A0A556AC80_9BURK|nr:sigma-54 dependent transcriptional regulator [Verticiella sediminum]TSH90491.1 sigma-54-dependent Fis family transcriptional regulator [Verticiella sediminum]
MTSSPTASGRRPAARKTTASARKKATQTAGPAPYGLLYGTSEAMQALCKQIGKVAPSMITVFIVGESGTGKELVARTIHDKSARADGPFVPVNCGAIPPSLIEAELFGHERGSFTGAIQSQPGYFEHAAGGTLFLDEVTEMPLEMQTKLLRVLEAGTFHRVGGTEEKRADVRIVAATNRDPQQAVQDNILREDLYYRLAVFPLRVPPLRERSGDIELLANRFLEVFNANQQTPKTYSPQALDAVRNYPWPGNVRELRNALYRAFIMADSIIELPPPGQPSGLASAKPTWRDGCLTLPVGTTLADAQRELILGILAHLDGDKRETARTLGISLKTLYNRLEAYQGKPVDEDEAAQ